MSGWEGRSAWPRAWAPSRSLPEPPTHKGLSKTHGHGTKGGSDRATNLSPPAPRNTGFWECILHKNRDFDLVHSESPSTQYSAEHVVGTNKYFLIKYWAGQKVHSGAFHKMLWKNPKELLGQPNKNKGGLEQITYPFLASVSLSVNGNPDPYMGEARGGPDEARSGRHRTGAHRMGAQLDPGAPYPSGIPPQLAGTHLLHHLELISEALHLLLQILQLVLLHSQQHLRSQVPG